jgi:hypothetical protein
MSSRYGPTLDRTALFIAAEGDGWRRLTALAAFVLNLFVGVVDTESPATGLGVGARRTA